MRNDSTSRVRWGLAPCLALAALAACTMGSDPNPSEVRRDLALGAPKRSPADEQVVPATVMLGPVAAAPAPLAESSVRQEIADREHLVVAVGRDAAQCFDGAAEKAFAAACPDLAGSFLACPDRDALDLMMVGRADFALFSGCLSARELHAGLRQTRLGFELFALAVAPDFPARSLTRAQVRQVLTGQVSDWQQLGYDAGPVVAVVPAERGLAERAARALILGDDFAASAVRVATERHVADQILRNKGAIGVVRLTGRPLESGQRLLQIDWTSPSPEAFGYGTYPFGVPVQLVTSGQPSGLALRFLQFARSEDGVELLGRTLVVQSQGQ